MPKSVTRLMPRGAKSLFWGVFTPKTESAPMAIHLIALYPKVELVKNLTRRKGYHLTLDIFEQKAEKFIRLNRVAVGYGSQISGPIQVQARFSWIDWRQQMPLLNLRCFTKDGYWPETPTGDAIFLSFARGWKKQSTFQRFSFGPSNSGSSDYKFQRIGRGNLEIVCDDGSLNAGNDATGKEARALLLFRWNKRKFVVTLKTVLYLSPDEAQWKP